AALAENQADPVSVVVDNTTVSWANYGTGTVVRQGLAGGAPSSTVVANGRELYAISGGGNDGALYGLTYQMTSKTASVLRLSPGATPAATVAANLPGNAALASDAENAFFISGNEDASSPDGALESVPHTGLTRSVLAQGVAQPRAIAVDRTAIY